MNDKERAVILRCLCGIVGAEFVNDIRNEVGDLCGLIGVEPPRYGDYNIYEPDWEPQYTGREQ